MKLRKQSILEMQQILDALELLPPGDAARSHALLDRYLKEALLVCQNQLSKGYTEEKSIHIVNYCKMKLEFAQKQIENDNAEEGLSFAKTVVAFYLREARAEEAYPAEQEFTGEATN